MPKRLFALAGVFLVLGGAAALILRRPERPEPAHPLKAFTPDAFFRVVIDRQGSPELALERKAGLWRLTSPVDDLADAKAADELVAAVSGVGIGTVVSEDPAAWPSYGLAEADAVHVKVFSRDQAVPMFDGWFGKPALGDQTLYLRGARQKPVYLAENVARAELLKSPDDFRERALFPDKLGPIQSVVISAGAESLPLGKGSVEWSAAVHLRIADFSAGKVEAGFDHPALIVEAVGSARAARWLIGKPKPEAKGKPLYRYARCDERPGVLALVALSDTEPLIKALKR
jgi:hypothetical protein